MATSSGEEESNSAPTYFPLISSLESSADVTEVAVERCPLCCCSRRPFTCAACVNEGKFTHSKTKDSENERFHAKLQKWEALKRERTKLLERFQDDLSLRNRLIQKKTAVQHQKDNLQLLKEAVAAGAEALQGEKELLKNLQEENCSVQSKAKKHSEKLHKICRYINQTKHHTTRQEVTLDKKLEELSAIRREFLDLLVRFIFTINEVKPKSECDSMMMSTVSALAEARRMSYVRGKWIYLDNGDQQYSVIEPTLPGNGSYSAYSLWVKESASASTHESDLSQRNPGNTISAALLYTTQMISIIAYALDVHLPKRLCYSVFNSNEMTERQFSKAVAKLNYNILHLCYSQDVNPELLHPLHTIHNILVLLKSENIGRCGPFDITLDLLQSVFDDSHFTHSDDDESDSSSDGETHGDWETVPTNLPEHDVPTRSSFSSTSTVQSQAQNNNLQPTDTTLSTAGGLMSTAAASVASFWRAATGQAEKR